MGLDYVAIRVPDVSKYYMCVLYVYVCVCILVQSVLWKTQYANKKPNM